MRRALIASRRPTSLVGKDHLGHWLNDKSPQSRHFGAGNGVNPAWFTFNLGSGFSFAKILKEMSTLQDALWYFEISTTARRVHDKHIALAHLCRIISFQLFFRSILPRDHIFTAFSSPAAHGSGGLGYSVRR